MTLSPSLLHAIHHLLTRAGSMNPTRLHRLLYRAQGGTWVHTSAPLFEEDFIAGCNGPLLPDLFEAHRGKFKISLETLPGGGPKVLSEEQRLILNHVHDAYAYMDGFTMDDEFQRCPLVLAGRQGLDAMHPSGPVLPKASIGDRYRVWRWG